MSSQEYVHIMSGAWCSVRNMYTLNNMSGAGVQSRICTHYVSSLVSSQEYDTQYVRSLVSSQEYYLQYVRILLFMS